MHSVNELGNDARMNLSHVVTLTVQPDREVDTDTAVHVARSWADNMNLIPGITSTTRDERWLSVQGATRGDVDDLAYLAADATRHLAAELREVGVEVSSWLGVEVVLAEELARRKPVRAMPDVVDIGQLAELAGLSRQRIYQMRSEWKQGRRSDFPAEALPDSGWYVRAVAEHWAATRKTKPGPAPRAEGPAA